MIQRLVLLYIIVYLYKKMEMLGINTNEQLGDIFYRISSRNEQTQTRKMFSISQTFVDTYTYKSYFILSRHEGREI